MPFGIPTGSLRHLSSKVTDLLAAVLRCAGYHPRNELPALVRPTHSVIAPNRDVEPTDLVWQSRSLGD
jgi:hypothetical protein